MNFFHCPFAQRYCSVRFCLVLPVTSILIDVISSLLRVISCSTPCHWSTILTCPLHTASSAEAARRQVAESQFASPRSVRRRPAAPSSVAVAASAGEPCTSSAPAVTSTASATSPVTAATPVAPTDAEDERALSAAAAAVRVKLAWATGQLESANSVEGAVQLVGLIRACADALQALRRPVAAVQEPPAV